MLEAMERELQAALGAACDPLGLAVASTKIWDQPPVAFDPRCVAAVRGAAEACGFKVRDMVSGAGHDAAYMARVAPTAMIFVPCRGGISHNEAEFSSQGAVRRRRPGAAAGRARLRPPAGGAVRITYPSCMDGPRLARTFDGVTTGVLGAVMYTAC